MQSQVLAEHSADVIKVTKEKKEEEEYNHLYTILYHIQDKQSISLFISPPLSLSLLQ